VIEYGAELAAGLRTPEVFRSLCDHSGLTRAQLDHVAQTEAMMPTAIRYAVWKGQQRKRGRRMGPAAGWSGITSPRREGFWRRQTHPRRAVRTCRRRRREGMVDECAPLSARRLDQRRQNTLSTTPMWIGGA
jgi:hypothetical protein